MATVRTLLAFVVGFAFLGAIAATLAAPGWVTWYATPGIGPAQCDCALVTRKAADLVIGFQAYGTLIGAVVGLLLGGGFVWWRRSRVPTVTVR